VLVEELFRPVALLLDVDGLRQDAGVHPAIDSAIRDVAVAGANGPDVQEPLRHGATTSVVVAMPYRFFRIALYPKAYRFSAKISASRKLGIFSRSFLLLRGRGQLRFQHVGANVPQVSILGASSF
jgi:hypothetical protein